LQSICLHGLEDIEARFLIYDALNEVSGFPACDQFIIDDDPLSA
jgi:hypothetical protein